MKKESKKSLHKKAWTLMSQWVRSKDANFSGYTGCFTCKKSFLWRELDAGHYIHNKLDFDPINIKPQCTYCNRFLHGNLGVYGESLIKKYGIDRINELRKIATQKGNDYSVTELKKIIRDLEEKLDL